MKFFSDIPESDISYGVGVIAGSIAISWGLPLSASIVAGLCFIFYGAYRLRRDSKHLSPGGKDDK